MTRDGGDSQKLGLIADTDTGQIAMSDSEFVELVRMLHHYAT